MVTRPLSLILGGAFGHARSLIISGVGADRTFLTLREYFPDVRRAAIRELAAGLRLEHINSILIGRFHQSGDIPLDLTSTSLYNQRDNYNYVFSLTGVNPNTGALEVRTSTFGSDVRLTANEAADALGDQLVDTHAEFSILIENVRLINVTRRPDAPW